MPTFHIPERKVILSCISALCITVLNLSDAVKAVFAEQKIPIFLTLTAKGKQWEIIYKNKFSRKIQHKLDRSKEVHYSSYTVRHPTF